MTDHVKQMLDTYPRSFNVDADLLTETIQALVDCSNTCTQCADACLSEEDVAMMVKCIRLDLDCADICAVTSRVVSRQTDYDAAVTPGPAGRLRAVLQELRRRVRGPWRQHGPLPGLRRSLPAL